MGGKRRKVRLYFDCETNMKLARVNTAIFIFADGDIVIIDRDITEYGFVHHTGASEGYFLDMTWKGCYIWNGEDQNYELKAKDFEGAELVSLDLEDDVPEKYEVKVRAWRAYD